MRSTWNVAQNCSNSLDVNYAPLSLTVVSTTPYLANSSCNLFTVFVDVGLFIWKTSGHLEWLSTTTK